MPQMLISTTVAAQEAGCSEPFVRMCVATDAVPGFVIRTARGRKPWQAVHPDGLQKLRELAAKQRAQRATGREDE
jgi:hypothetical protein